MNNQIQDYGLVYLIVEICSAVFSMLFSVLMIILHGEQKKQFRKV